MAPTRHGLCAFDADTLPIRKPEAAGVGANETWMTIFIQARTAVSRLSAHDLSFPLVAFSFREIAGSLDAPLRTTEWLDAFSGSQGEARVNCLWPRLNGRRLRADVETSRLKTFLSSWPRFILASRSQLLNGHMGRKRYADMAQRWRVAIRCLILSDTPYGTHLVDTHKASNGVVLPGLSREAFHLLFACHPRH